jgi:hypothetical protein
VRIVGTAPSAGDFVGEENCVCGFLLDAYAADAHDDVCYADPDTGHIVDRCPSCDRSLWP